MSKQYYQISSTGYPVVSPIQLDDTFIEYTVGEEPQELVDALEELEAQELVEKESQEASALRDAQMLEGFEYNGVKCSVTSEDGNAILQVKGAFELGLTETVIKFKNGSSLAMTSGEFVDFALEFVTERNKFFS